MNRETALDGLHRLKPYPTDKDSGVEWLGKIPAHWSFLALKTLCRLSYGDSLSIEERHDGNTDVFGSNGPVGSHDCPNTLGPCLIVGRKGSFGKVNYSSNPVFAIDTTFFIDSRNTYAVIRWLYYIFSCLRLDTVSRDSAIPGLDREDVYSRTVPFCSLEEQHAIAAFLDRETAKIDALIEKKGRLIELLQEKRTALITQAVTKGLDPTVPMKDSGVEWLGEIPTHWALVPLKSLTLARPGSIKTGPFGSQLLASDMAQEEIKVYNQRNVIAHDFTAGENYISMSKFRELASFEVFKNDILVTTRGTIGKSAIVPKGAERGILHPCLLRIQPDSDKIKIAYLALIIQESNLVINQLALASNATTIDVIYSDTIGRVLIPCPPMNEQSAIFEFLDGMTAKIDALKSSIQEAIASLREYRTALISAAVTGKIDVREA
jgi:type I restriction enzyme S subunit